MLDCIRLVQRTAMQTVDRIITTGVALALLAGIAVKLKIFGGSPQPRADTNNPPTRSRPMADFIISGGYHDHDL